MKLATMRLKVVVPVSSERAEAADSFDAFKELGDTVLEAINKTCQARSRAPIDSTVAMALDPDTVDLPELPTGWFYSVWSVDTLPQNEAAA